MDSNTEIARYFEGLSDDGLREALSLYRLLAHLGHTELDTVALLKVYER